MFVENGYNEIDSVHGDWESCTFILLSLQQVLNDECDAGYFLAHD